MTEDNYKVRPYTGGKSEEMFARIDALLKSKASVPAPVPSEKVSEAVTEELVLQPETEKNVAVNQTENISVMPAVVEQTVTAEDIVPVTADNSAEIITPEYESAALVPYNGFMTDDRNSEIQETSGNIGLPNGRRFSRRTVLFTSVAAGVLIVWGIGSLFHVNKPHVEKKKPKTEKVAENPKKAVFQNEAGEITAGFSIWDYAPTKDAIADYNKVLTEKTKIVINANTAKYDFNENFSAAKFNPLFENLGRRESGNDYTESPYSSSHAFGKYQSMPETMVIYGYLEKTDKNPDIDGIRNWKHQSFDSQHMTIIYDGRVNHYKWTGQDGMNSLTDWCNTEKGHELQEKFGRSHYADNVAAIRKNGKDLYNTLHIVNLPVFKKNKIQRYDRKIILVDEPGLAYAAHLMGAGGIMTIVRNGFKPSGKLSDDVNSNIATAVEYLERGTAVDQKIRKTGKTYDMLVQEHPDYPQMKEKLDIMIAGNSSSVSEVYEQVKQLVENGRDLTAPDSLKSAAVNAKKLNM